MPACSVYGCTNHSKKTKGTTDIKYFRFPKNNDLIKSWIDACRRKDKFNIDNARICSIHFDDLSFELSLKYRLLNYQPINSRTLKADAFPTLKLPTSQTQMTTNSTEKLLKRNRHKQIDDVLNVNENNIQEMPAEELQRKLDKKNGIIHPTDLQPEATIQNVDETLQISIKPEPEEIYLKQDEILVKEEPDYDPFDDGNDTKKEEDYYINPTDLGQCSSATTSSFRQVSTNEAFIQHVRQKLNSFDESTSILVKNIINKVLVDAESGVLDPSKYNCDAAVSIQCKREI